MIEKIEFFNLFRTDIQKNMLKFEQQRKNLAFGFLVRAWTLGFLCFGLFLVATAFLLFEWLPSSPGLALLLSFIILILAILYSLSYLEDYRDKIDEFLMQMKTTFLNQILKIIGNVTWSIDKSIPYCKAENLIGEYNKVPFRIIETKDNVFLTFRTKKSFQSETIVKAKNNFNFNYKIISTLSLICSIIVTFMIPVLLIKFGHKSGEITHAYIIDSLKYIIVAIICAIYSLVSLIRFCKKYKVTKTEDVVLTRDFIIYTEDEVMARYFLTPSFIERFKNIQTAFGRKNISCSCKNDEVCFKIDKPKNLFEVCSVFIPLSDSKPIIDLYNEINAIFKIIDYFKLSDDTKI